MSIFQHYLPSGSSSGGGNGGHHHQHQALKKSQFYVWFLGAQESQGLRGDEFVWPSIRQLAKEADRHSPNKLTLQISAKGLKIIQTLPTISKSGKVKMEVMKLVVPAHSLTYSTLGRQPNGDVVGCIMLLFNPETRCPIHVHAYRCDSPETACIMNSTLQVLINRPENQRRIGEVENRLMLKGLLYPRPHRRAHLANLHSDGGDSDDVDGVHSRSAFSGDSLDYASPIHSELGHDDSGEDVAITTTTSDGDFVAAERLACLHRAVFQELKEKLQSKGPLLLPPKDYSDTLRKVGTLTTRKYEERRAKSRQVVGTLSANAILSYCNNALGDYELRSPYRNPASNNCLRDDDDNILRRTKRYSCAFENFDDFADEKSAALINSNGRYRFSISDLPVQNNHVTYNNAPVVNYYNNASGSNGIVNRNDSFLSSPATSANHRPPPLRKFGDTMKPKNDMACAVATSRNPATPTRNGGVASGGNHRSNSNNWMIRPTKFKSMENLSQAAAAVNFDPTPNDEGDDWRRRHRTTTSRNLDGNEKSFQNVWLLPKLVDPFGRKYDQRVKVNNFLDTPENRRSQMLINGRQVPSSWYIGPCSGYMI